MIIELTIANLDGTSYSIKTDTARYALAFLGKHESTIKSLSLKVEFKNEYAYKFLELMKEKENER